MNASIRKPNHKKVRDFLAGRTASAVADDLLDRNPWICEEEGVAFGPIGSRIVERLPDPNARAFVLGSASVGFSLSPLKAGASFRRSDGPDRPSDIDVAIVCNSTFLEIWREMLLEDFRSAGGVRTEARQNIYYGRSDQRDVPRRSAVAAEILSLRGEVRRHPVFASYPASIRMYRRVEDLKSYLCWSIRKLALEVN